MVDAAKLREIAEGLQALGYLHYAVAVREAAIEMDELAMLRRAQHNMDELIAALKPTSDHAIIMARLRAGAAAVRLSPRPAAAAYPDIPESAFPDTGNSGWWRDTRGAP